MTALLVVDVLRIVAGLALLYFGAEWLVAGAARLGRSLGISSVLVGLTVVAYGTSAPEVVVGVQAALTGLPAIALGNVIGSNIANLGLILGATALVSPPRVAGALPRREVRVLVVSALALPLLLLDGEVSRWEGAALLAAALGYTVWMIRTSRADGHEASDAAQVTADAAEAVSGAARAKLGALVLVGLVALVVGGSVFVDGAASLARTIGMSERMVGLTIVAVGTSLPELATSLMAARKGHSDIAVGNVIGSNVFNVLLCLGAAAVVGRVGAPFASVRADLLVLAAVTAITAVMMRTARTISRGEGAVLLAAYAAYLVWLGLG
ncbi:calcium/sodium antiporter [Sandaracinus amylolyticus]|uniref:Inner membrane protein YrbG n=1 Tax=Sandaracinus amylolyticus TaxID=927083 RepID=A0A0F6YLU0_9BACT|nr:calcium/sodium antiporter [Sandaracinus amylolyticus]AKF08645.1 Inner membrane protein YrbG [Sandaracinus amylolyticus]